MNSLNSKSGKNEIYTHFVTGATGLLGVALTEFLLKRGDRVVCLVRDEVPQSRFWLDPIFRQAIVVRGDILDPFVTKRVMYEYDVNCVFHLAAQTLVGIANREPLTTLRTNIEGTWNVLEAFRDYSSQTKRLVALVVASSDKAYGNLLGQTYNENSPLNGNHPYDVSKSCADLIAQTYANTFGLNLGVTRCGNFFGPGDLNGSRLVPGTILSVLRGQRPVLRSDGSLIRDYIYVGDGAEAYWCLAEGLFKKKIHYPRVAYNFSYGETRTALEVVRLILKSMGSSLEPLILGEAHNEIPVQRLDSELARIDLAWKPRWGFERGLQDTIEWYSSNAKHLNMPTD